MRPKLFLIKSEYNDKLKQVLQKAGVDFELFEEASSEQAYHFYSRHGIILLPALKISENEIIYGAEAICVYCERRLTERGR